jgi:hypothetical protein
MPLHGLQDESSIGEMPDRGMLVALPKLWRPVPTCGFRRHDPRWEPGLLAAHAGICAGGGEQSPSLPRRAFFKDLRTTQIGRLTASQIASASAASFFWRLT